MSSNKILITGGSGFIGTNAVTYFLNRGFEVLNLDIKKPQNENHNIFWRECDILDLEKYEKLTKEFSPDYFLHLAARTDLNEKRNLNGYSANISGVENTIKVVNSCESIKRVIFTSSRMVCRIDYLPQNDKDYCPPNLYGESKVIGEKLVRQSDIKVSWTIIRPTSIWGPWFDIPYKMFFTTIKKRIYFHPGDFNPSKSFGYVENSVYQIDKLFQAKSESINRKLFYLCDYPPLEIRSWAELICKEMKIKYIPTIPFPLLKVAAYFGDIFKNLGFYRFPISSFRLSNLITEMVYDTKELELICGRLPFGIEEGVRKTVKWLNKN